MHRIVIWSNQAQFILRWYTGTLSHNTDLCTLCWLLIEINLYCGGALSHNSDLVYPLLAPIKINLYCAGTLVHCHTTLICAPSAGSNQDQFILRWYTGTLSHNSDLVDTLLPNQLQCILRWYNGKLSHISDLVYPLLPPSSQIVLT
jgi:hypothetical protein